MNENRWSQERKLASLDPDFQNRVLNVLDRLRAAGFKPHVVYAWRSKETQAKLVERGVSKTMNSKHCVGVEGEGRACDIVDADHWWGAGEDQDEAQALVFFGALGLAALEEGLSWGGTWSWKDWAHIEAKT